MELTKSICSLALSLRKKEGIRVRQPLESITLCLGAGYKQSDVLSELVESETNIKNIIFSHNSSGLVKRKLVPNFSVLGKKYGGMTKKIISEIQQFSESDFKQYEQFQKISISVDGEKIILCGDDLVVKIEDMPGFLTAKTDSVIISLNTNLSEELLSEGFAREFVNKVQGFRKDLGLLVVDRISISVFGDSGGVEILLNQKKYVLEEVLGDDILLIGSVPKNNRLFEFNNYKLYIAIQKS